MKQTIIAIVLAVPLSVVSTVAYIQSQNDDQQQPPTDTIVIEDPTSDQADQSPTPAPTTNQAGSVSLLDFQDDLIDVIREAKKSVVSVIATKNIAYIYADDPLDFFRRRGEQEVIRQPQEIGGGSGIYASQEGYIITNKHVVEDSTADYSVIFADGTTADVQQSRLDPVIDIAVLKIDTNDIPQQARPADFIVFDDEVAVGSLTIAIGNTLNEFQNSVTLGIVSGRNRKLMSEIENIYAGLYQTDTAISQGNSGGPLIRVDGKTIGVNTAISTQGNDIGFAIPITQEFVDATLESVDKNDEIIRPFIGIQYLDIDRRVQSELDIDDNIGILIMDVVAGSAAAQAGLQAEDIVLAIDDKIIDERNPFLYQLFTRKPGDTVVFTIKRDGQIQRVDVALSQNNQR